jgi:hypothetical protein
MNTAKVQDVLSPILREIRDTTFTEGYAPHASQAECVGLLISKFFQWDGLQILRAAMFALEDANHHSESAKIAEMIDALERTSERAQRKIDEAA